MRKETLTELRADELRQVAGADGSGLPCISSPVRCLSDFAISLCGCLTDYCSIDVC